MNKTKIIMTRDMPQSNLQKGMEGYIDGYVRGGDERPYAIIVSYKIVDLAPFHSFQARP